MTAAIINTEKIHNGPGRKEADTDAHTTRSFLNTAIRNILRINTTTGDDRRLPPDAGRGWVGSRVGGRGWSVGGGDMYHNENTARAVVDSSL